MDAVAAAEARTRRPPGLASSNSYASASASRPLPLTCARSLTNHIVSAGCNSFSDAVIAADADAVDPLKHDRSSEPAQPESSPDGPSAANAADDDDDAKYDDTDTATGSRAAGPGRKPEPADKETKSLR
jgi:hypothetical protein